MSEFKDLTAETDQLIESILLNPAGGIVRGNIRPEYYVDFGPDSLVCRSGKEALKFYGRGGIKILDVNLDKLFKLVEFYQKITNRGADFLQEKRFFLDGSQLSINPATSILISRKYNTVIGASPYVSGQKLEESQTSRNFLATVSNALNNRFGVQGISLLEYNVQTLDDGLVAVDICSNLDHLKRKSLYERLSTFK